MLKIIVYPYLVTMSCSNLTRIAYNLYFVVHIRRLIFRTGVVHHSVVCLFFPVHNNPHCRPYKILPDFIAYFVLQAHQTVKSLLLYLGSNVVIVMFGGIGSFLLAIGESPHALETHVAHKLQQFFKILLRLARMTYHKRGAKHNAGHFTPYALYKLIGLPLVDIATHKGKHIVADMLERKIQILANIVPLAHYT